MMKTILNNYQPVFCTMLLSLLVLTMSSCSTECVGENATVEISNQWNRSIYVEVYSGGYVTHNVTLHDGEHISFIVDINEIEIRTREKGFLLFPDKDIAHIDASGCFDYEVIAYTDPNNHDRHFLETNHVPR